MLTKQEILLGKGAQGGEQEGKGTQENCSATWFAVSGFMVMGLVSRSSLTKHSDSESFLVAHPPMVHNSQQTCFNNQSIDFSKRAIVSLHVGQNEGEIL